MPESTTANALCATWTKRPSGEPARPVEPAPTRATTPSSPVTRRETCARARVSPAGTRWSHPFPSLWCPAGGSNLRQGAANPQSSPGTDPSQVGRSFRYPSRRSLRVRRRRRMTVRLPASSGSQNAKLGARTCAHRRSPRAGPRDPPRGTRNRGRTAPEPPDAGEPRRHRPIRRSRPACTAQRMPKTAGLSKPLAVPHPHRSNTTVALPRRTLAWRPIVRQRPRRRHRQPVLNRGEPTANRAELRRNPGAGSDPISSPPDAVLQICSRLVEKQPRQTIIKDHHQTRKTPPNLRKLRWRGFGCKSGAEGIRTPDPLTASQVRYQLRHSPLPERSYTTVVWRDERGRRCRRC
jgi:hypothetical protein